ncbi:neuronal pentraxin-1-like [Ptychodera flava]|uniref:neuronal pentraxin-1-like n=1 Tax=Ptychodera flava TaxID=63121 RepID=UPI00396AA73C
MARIKVLMKILILIICAFKCTHCQSQDGNVLELKSADTSIKVSTSAPDLSALTACVWVTSTQNRQAAIVSYAVSEEDNEFLMFYDYYPNAFKIHIRGSESQFHGYTLHDGSWHHVCTTWSSNDGRLAFYHNGVTADKTKYVMAGKMVRGGGVLVLGQDQDSVGGGFEEHQAFIGNLTDFNMWSTALNANQIAMIKADCSIGGDVFTWNVTALQIEGDVSQTNTSGCGELSFPLALIHVDNVMSS